MSFWKSVTKFGKRYGGDIAASTFAPFAGYAALDEARKIFGGDGGGNHSPAPGAPSMPAQPQLPNGIAPQNNGMGGMMMPGISLPSMSSYIQPYEQAKSNAQDTYNQAVPVILQQYKDLRGQLQQQHKQDLNDLATATHQAVVQQSRNANDLQQQTAAPIADLQSQFGGAAPASVVSGVVAKNAQQQADLKDAAANQAQYSKNIQTQQNQNNAGNMSDASMAQQGAIQGAQQNLKSLLGQIGLKEADAKTQYAQMQASAAQNAFDNMLKLQQVQQQQIQNNPFYQAQQQQAGSNIGTYANQGALSQLGSANNNASTWKDSWKVLNDLYGKSGGDPGKMADLLTQSKIGQGQYQFNDGSTLRKKLNTDFLKNWISEYGNMRNNLLGQQYQRAYGG